MGSKYIHCCEMSLCYLGGEITTENVLYTESSLRMSAKQLHAASICLSFTPLGVFVGESLCFTIVPNTEASPRGERQ